MAAMMTANAVIKAMAGGAILHKQYIEGKAAYWLDDGRGRCIKVPWKEGKQVSESSMVEVCEPGLLDNCAQSYIVQNRNT
jgi:hypothetical protein